MTVPDADATALPDLVGWRDDRRRQPKISHLLASDLRRQILSGQLPTDQRLPPEADLRASLGVSRETLREALRILESQSLLEVRRGRGGGAVVRQPGLESVNRYVALLLQQRGTTLSHLDEVRTLLEPAAAELVVAHASDDDLARLGQLHDAERTAADDALTFAVRSAAFDHAVAELSGNDTLLVVGGIFREIFVGQVYAAVTGSGTTSTEGVADHVLAGHRAFLDAAHGGDGATARQAWEEHLTTTAGVLASRGLGPQAIDVTPLWRAWVARSEDGASSRLAATVATELRARMAEGSLREGDRLPPLPELGEEFGVSRPTLREAMRILEVEHLLDLRTGDRAGATVRAPSSRMAAQMAGTVLQARATTLADLSRAVRAIEPPLMGLAAVRPANDVVGGLRDALDELRAVAGDTARFLRAWREGKDLVFSAFANPALAVVGELLGWVEVGVEPTLAADARALPRITEANRRTAERFGAYVDAVAGRDTDAATAAWEACLAVNAPYLEQSEVGTRLVIDLFA